MPKPAKKNADAPPDAANPADPEPQPILSEKAAEEAFNALRPRMLDLDPKQLSAVTVDLERATVAAAAIGRWVKGKEARARFAALPAEHFDQAHADELEQVAMATWHAAVALRSASAGKSEAKLPVTLVQEATAVKQRMLDLLAYHYGSDPVDGPEIADIRLGSGYGDLAADLVRLARLYAKHRDQVKLDPKNYLPTDEADAGRIANTIFRELGEAKNQDQRTWTDLAQRAFTLLDEVYSEVAAAGAWLWRHEDAPSLFPSLYAMGRAARAASKPPNGEPGAGKGGDAGKTNEG